MSKFDLYPSPVEALATRYYHMLFQGPDFAAGIYVLCTAEQESVRTIEIMETFVDFLGQRHLISEDMFYRIFTREGGDLLRILTHCADLSLKPL